VWQGWRWLGFGKAGLDFVAVGKENFSHITTVSAYSEFQYYL